MVATLPGPYRVNGTQAATFTMPASSSASLNSWPSLRAEIEDFASSAPALAWTYPWPEDELRGVCGGCQVIRRMPADDEPLVFARLRPMTPDERGGR